MEIELLPSWFESSIREANWVIEGDKFVTIKSLAFRGN